MLKRFATFLLSLATVISSGCERPSASNTPPPARPAQVTAAVANHTTLSEASTVVGTLIAAHKIQIFNQVEGRIIALPYREGDRVPQGAELVKLDDAVARAELVKAMARQRQAELNLARMEKLYERKAASEDEVARARTDLELAQAEERLQRTLLARTIIRAPISGVISERLREPGDVAPTHSHILTLIDPSRLRVDVPLSELLLPRLSKGDIVEVRLDALGTQSFDAHITRIHPVIDPETRQGRVEVELDAIPLGALPGQLARISFITHTIEGLVVPFAALRHDREGAYVYRVDGNDTARQTQVRAGVQLGDSVEILQGLNAGDRVIVSGLLNVSDGEAVHVVGARQSTPPLAVGNPPKQFKLRQTTGSAGEI